MVVPLPIREDGQGNLLVCLGADGVSDDEFKIFAIAIKAEYVFAVICGGFSFKSFEIVVVQDFSYLITYGSKRAGPGKRYCLFFIFLCQFLVDDSLEFLEELSLWVGRNIGQGDVLTDELVHCLRLVIVGYLVVLVIGC